MRHRALMILVLVGNCATGLSGTPAQVDPAAVSWSLPDDRLGIRTAPLLLLSRSDVCAEVKLTPEQQTQASAAINELYSRALATKGLSAEQAKAARKAIDDAQNTWVLNHLSAEQLARLSQIDLQWEGPAALVSRPIVADSLGLTREQRAALALAVARRNSARMLPTYSRADERQLAQTALSLLSDTQKARWKLILGPDFTPKVAATPAPAATR